MNIVVIGLGSMGKRRIRILKDFFFEHVENIVGIDKLEVRRKDVSKLYDIECFESLSDAIKNFKFDIGFICTSPQSHYSVALELINKGINIFSEINLLNENHNKLIDLLKSKAVKFFLSSTPLYSDDRMYINNYIKNKKNITYIYHVGQYLPDWHPWENYKDFFASDKSTNACREIIMIEFPWIIETFGDIEDVYVQCKKNTSLEINFPDTYIINVKHKNGFIGIICVDVVSRIPVRQLTVFNEDLYLTWKGSVDSICIFDKDNKVPTMVNCGNRALHNKNYAKFINEISYINEIEAFFDYMINNNMPLYTLDKDIMVLELADKIEGIHR